jgi:hypothetical protein
MIAKKGEDRPPYHELSVSVQKWYTKDKGVRIQIELKKLL